MSSTGTVIWLFRLHSLLEKLCHISGERCWVKQLPAAPCCLERPWKSTQATPGLQAEARWCNSSVLTSLVINTGNATDVRLLLPIPLDLFRVLPKSRIWLPSLAFLGIIQWSSKAHRESSFQIHNTRNSYLIGKQTNKQAAMLCLNNVFDLLKISTIFFLIHIYPSIFT